MAEESIQLVRLQLENFSDKFDDYYGEGHMVLAKHAAFPAFITADLLYQLWANFGTFQTRDDIPRSTSIPLLAVSDLLLSSLFRKTGKDVYEMLPQLRAYLLEELTNDPRFGKERLKRLAAFLYQYIDDQPDRPEWVNFKEAQRLTALLALSPAMATRQALGQLVDKVKSSYVNSSIGIANLISSWTRQHTDVAEELTRILESASDDAPADPVTSMPATDGKMPVISARQTEGAIPFNLPPHISNRLQTVLPPAPAAETKKEEPVKAIPVTIYACLVAIDSYPDREKGALKKNVSDSKKVQNFLQKSFGDISRQASKLMGSKVQVDTRVLHNREATRANILSALETALAKAKENDQVLFYFTGHSADPEDQSFPRGLVPYDYNPDLERQTLISSEIIRQIIDQFVSKNPYITLVMDTSAPPSPFIIDTSNPRQVVFTSGFYGGLSFENKEGGLFTSALLEILNNSKGIISYRELCRRVLASRVFESVHQTPFLIGHDEAWSRPFLAASPDRQAQSISLLQDLHYPAVMRKGDTVDAIDQFRKDFLLSDTDDVLQLLQWYAFVQAYRELKIALVGRRFTQKHNYLTDYNDILVTPHTKTSFLDQASFSLTSEGELKNASQKGHKKIISDANVLLVGINRDLLENLPFCYALLRLLFLARLQGKQTGIIIEETCDWRNTPFSQYKVFPSNGEPMESRSGFALIRTELQHHLNLLSRFIAQGKGNINLPDNGIRKKIEEAADTHELDLSGLGLTQLPGQVASLDLRTINLQNNKFSQLPVQLKNMNPVRLLLNGNPLTSLPDWLYKMNKLQVLEIEHTLISHLSPQIGQLTALHTLRLSHSPVEILPPELKQLFLKKLTLKSCPLISVPPSVLTSANPASALQRLAQEDDMPYYELPGGKPLIIFLATENTYLKELRKKIWDIETRLPLGKIEQPNYNCVFIAHQEFQKPYRWFSLLELYSKDLVLLYYYDIRNPTSENEKDYTGIYKIIRAFGKPFHLFYDGVQTAGSWTQALLPPSSLLIKDNPSPFSNLDFITGFFKKFISGKSIKESYASAKKSTAPGTKKAVIAKK